MTKVKTLYSIAILMPGDMGHACATIFRQSGFRVVTCLEGRSLRTQKLAKKSEIESLPSLAELVKNVDLILSILPPENALDQAKAVATAMTAVNTYPDYVDCNAISPATSKQAAKIFDGMQTNFIDGGIIGLNPIKEKGRTRLYVSGKDTSLVRQLDGNGMIVHDLGQDIGRASAMKMVYASSTKGAFSLYAAVALMAELTGLREELFREFAESQPNTLASIEKMVPRIPIDAKRWIFEMAEIAKTYDSFGVTPNFHKGAGDIMELANRTPIAKQTRENSNDEHTLAEVLELYTNAMAKRRDD